MSSTWTTVGAGADQRAVPGGPHVQRAAPADDQVGARDQLGGAGRRSRRRPRATTGDRGRVLSPPPTLASDRPRRGRSGARDDGRRGSARQPDRVGERLRQGVCAVRPAWIARLRLRRRRNDHTATAPGEPSPPDRARPRTVCDRERDGAPESGAAAAAATLARRARTTSCWVSLADEELEDVCAALDLCAPLADAIELNASSPNAGWTHRADHVGALVAAMRPRTRTPLVREGAAVHHGRGASRRALAIVEAAQQAGAVGLTASNTVPVTDARMSTGRGGLSGGPLTAAHPRDRGRHPSGDRGRAADQRVRRHLHGRADARACLDAGAATVQVYTGLIYEGPAVASRIVAGLGALAPPELRLQARRAPSDCPPITDDPQTTVADAAPRADLDGGGRDRRAPGRRGQALRVGRRRRRRRPRRPRGGVLLDARPVGLGQDDLPADDRRVREPNRGPDLPRRPRRHPASRPTTAT